METSSAKRVCVVTNSFPRYDSDYAGKAVADLLVVLSKKYEFHVVYPSNMEMPQSNLEPFYRHQVSYPFRTYPMSQVRGIDLMNMIRLFFSVVAKIKEVVRRHDIDLIHSYWAVPSGFLASLCSGNIPMVLTLMGSDIQIIANQLLFRYPVRYTLKKSSRIIARSNDLKHTAIELGASEGKISTIPGGVDTNRFLPMDRHMIRSELCLPNGFLAIFVGSLLKVKRADKLIKICAHLSKDSDFHLLIVGDGQEREDLKELAESIGLRKVLFMGNVPQEDMPLYMAASDVLVLASESEGLPRCVQEAMASGIPVVTSSVGGLPEIITDGINGYLTHNEAEMEERLRLLMASPHLVATIGANALEFARQNLSLDMVVKRTEELYASVLEEVRGAI